jgi:hypothetical protein
LKFSQSIVPLDFDLQKFGEQKSSINRFSIKPVKIGTQPLNNSLTPVRDLFAPNMFIQLTDDERLNRPSFERMLSGFELENSDTLVIGSTQTVNVTAEISDTDSQQMTIPSGLADMSLQFSNLVRTSSATFKSAASIQNRILQRGYQHIAPKVVAPFVIVGKDDLKPFDGQSFNSFSEAQQAIQKQPKVQRRMLQILERQEVI